MLSHLTLNSYKVAWITDDTVTQNDEQQYHLSNHQTIIKEWKQWIIHLSLIKNEYNYTFHRKQYNTAWKQIYWFEMYKHNMKTVSKKFASKISFLLIFSTNTMLSIHFKSVSNHNWNKHTFYFNNFFYFFIDFFNFQKILYCLYCL